MVSRRALSRPLENRSRVTEQRGGPEWALYDLRSDPSETTDLSEEHAALRDELIGEWERIAAETGAQLDFAIR